MAAREMRPAESRGQSATKGVPAGSIPEGARVQVTSQRGRPVQDGAVEPSPIIKPFHAAPTAPVKQRSLRQARKVTR